jgi:hypothetical protein
MPIPIAMGGDLNQVVTSVNNLATSVGKIKPENNAPQPYPDLQAISKHFDNATAQVDDGVKNGHVTQGHLDNIAGEFEAIAKELRRGHGQPVR